ncbi:sensor domain protein [Azotobacter vinelandii CA]|uniref:Sensor domain protein n=2 Tax=Azotobacter vinelandii TaxID=354 RepID=C1DIM1_AZOVD|nr:MHYT domain-containing protein [Azotobacter vinelandii]ACO78702.1 sensor domain protein [Azotobacter vinelandii DJ]AGK16649.1 sensor domain protein [Azotobacter vinelandii CA]AGK20670.1 sensor domain protein [Azotobacter vinelandii CA6]
MGASDSFFIDAATNASYLPGAYHPGLVLLSIFVSIFSATMALQTAQIARRAESALYRHITIGAGAIALGCGIWTMHFIGMLAFELPTHVHYSTGLTLLSLLPACAASWLALHMLVRPEVDGPQLAMSGTLVGLGIGAMHYSGMAAMQTPLLMYYEPVTFTLSIVVAISLAVLALWARTAA